MKSRSIKSTLLSGVIFSVSSLAQAASCCGGGSASSLILPKFAQGMVDLSFDTEIYNGYWDQNEIYHTDPPGSDMRQYRLNMGYAKRLASRWQASVNLPYVMNRNTYTSGSSSTEAIGDTTFNLFYEAFDGIKCVWKVKSWEDLIPAAYYGVSLTVPTGISPYDDKPHSTDITGRGFYRLDGTILLDKTIYPWSTSLLLSYGKHLERHINREYGKYVEPYDKKLGDRTLATLTVGYTHFLESMASLTYSLAFSRLREEESTLSGGLSDPASEIRKESFTATAAYASMDRDWVFKGSWGHAAPRHGRGKNFPVTDVFTFGVSYVFR